MQDTNIVPLGYLPYEGDNLEASSRIKSAGRLIQEENLGSSDELTCNTNSPFLSTADSLPDRSANDAVRLPSQTEGFDKSINSSHSFGLC